jgi:DNA-binding transcriptional regulator of glucitol operon
VHGRPTLKSILHPRWWGLHLFTIAITIGMVYAGHWQWTVAERRHGDLRNYGYALQWWAFTFFGFLMWWRVIRDASLDPPAIGDEPAHSETLYVGYRPPEATASERVEDSERRAYNEYLAHLNQQEDSK